MHFAFNDQQQALKESARRFLQRTSSLTQVLEVMETESGFDPEVWRELTSELGWTALTIPEAYGGCDLPFTDLVPLLSEMGAALYCGPYFSTVCLGTTALLRGGTPAQQERYLPPIATGELTATLAYQEPNAPWPGDQLQAEVRRDGDHYVLNGEKAHVLDGHTAGLVILAARSPETSGAGGISLFAVPGDTPGLSREVTPTLDQTRKQARLTLEDLRLGPDALLGSFEEGGPLLREVQNLAGIALAAEQVGAAERCLNTAVEYAKVRFQFGRAIGSFQAIKHKCADMMVRVESARSAAWYASWVAAERPEEVPSAAALAQSYCSEAFFECAAENIQIHGGIGFTWEHEAHLYFKRAQSSRTLLGAPAQHRARFAAERGL